MTASWAWTLLFMVGLTSVSASRGTEAVVRAAAALRVMTYNIHFGHENLGRVTSVVCAAEADVVGLQEVDVHWSERSGFADQAAEIAAACGMDYRFGPIYTLPPLEAGVPPRQFGVAILSRRPIVSWRSHSLTRLSTQEHTGPAPAPGFLQVTVDVDGTAVDVFNTHLDYRPDPSVRRTQVAEMLAIIGGEGRATILMGDMNAPPDGEELAPLFTRLRDAWSSVASDPGFTYPGDQSARRIDYIFTAGPVRTVTAHVPLTDASDHRPVVAELVLEPR